MIFPGVLLLCAAVFLLATVAGLRRFQFNQVFRPDATADPHELNPGDRMLEFEDVWFDAADGEHLHGWYMPCPEARATVLICHGNAGNISGRLDSVTFYRRLGLNVLIFDYRGYGRSTGSPSEAGLYLDAEAALAYLTDTRGIAVEDIVLLGRSLGGAVATHLALRARFAAVLIESTFTSIPDMAKHRYPRLPLWRLSFLQFDNASRIARIASPLLLVHSSDDETVPYRHGLELQKIAGGATRLITIQGSHSGGYMASGAAYEEPVREFLGSAGIALASHAHALDASHIEHGSARA